MSDPAKSIHVGTVTKASPGHADEGVRKLVDRGFESFEPYFCARRMAKIWRSSERDALDVIGDRDITLSTIGMFGDPVEEQPMDLLTLRGWRECIDHAHHFGARVGAGFTGRIRGQPLAENLARNRQIWTDRKRAADRGVNIALKIAPWQLGERRLEDCA